MKRAFDLICAIPAYFVLSPLLVFIAALILSIKGKPVFFRQKRPGRDGELFTLYKFCTMSNACDPSGILLSDGERLTSLGRFLRTLSVDELPELINVIKGEMSIVGPRPLLTQYLERYNSEQARRHDVRPGLTGWAQVNGRNAISWQERFALDLWYVDHWSLSLDFRIIAITLKKVLKREGISADGDATMPEFMGNS